MSAFYACLARLRLIRRWGLMRNVEAENVLEHSWRVSVLAHALALLRNRRFGGSVNPERAALLGLFHDAGEAFTGDLPTPVKYCNPQIRAAYHGIEREARRTLIGLLPADLRGEYRDLFEPVDEDAVEAELVRWADKLCAWLKCREELRGGNPEFIPAERTLRKKLSQCGLPEVACFLEEFGPAFDLSLDDLTPRGI